MTRSTVSKTLPSGPAWDVAKLFPEQGAWTEADYLALNTNQLVEFSNGTIEVLVMPTVGHQRIGRYLFNLLFAFTLAGRLGETFFAPTKVRLWRGKIREPDVMFLQAGRPATPGRAQYVNGADLVMEVVSPDDPERDTDKKRGEYARAGIREYWIIDPRNATIMVLVLDGKRYKESGRYSKGQMARSALLAGFEADVAAAFAAANG